MTHSPIHCPLSSGWLFLRTRNGGALVSLYRTLCLAREIDRREQDFVRRGEAFFHVSGAGHEASAAIARHLTDDDWLHLHYRDKALLLARGVPVQEFFLSLLGKANSHSAGRQMSAHFSDPSRRILSIVGPVGNNALQAVGVAAAIKQKVALENVEKISQPVRVSSIKNQPSQPNFEPEALADTAQSTSPIVLCSVGDGTTQQGEFLEAVAEAVRDSLPVLFVVEDNQLAISVHTAGRTFFSLPDGPGRELFGLPIHFADGSDPLAVDEICSRLIPEIRHSHRPSILVLHMARLSDHTNSDDQERYRETTEIARDSAHHNPIIRLENHLTAIRISSVELSQIRDSIISEVTLAADGAFNSPDPQPTFTAKAPLPLAYLERREHRGTDASPRLTMREALNASLHEHLESDPRVFLFGQDIEDPKGDVFGVTRGLSTAFPGRVRNSALSESTIIGTCIGRALAGQRPVAFIQFADFLPLAFNQIVSELGSMYWRTNGGWQCPVIVMVTCGGYKPGLGPFHAQTMESLAVHIPGIDVVMPAFAGDAAGLLNAAFESNRPTIFFYPKSCLNLADRSTSNDVQQQFVPLGKARRVSKGNDLTLVTWGNPLAQCEQTANALAEAGCTVDLFDLRSLSPWDEAAIVASAQSTGRLVVVHEDNQTCGFGAEVVATVAEKARRPIQCRRITRPDTYIPSHYGNQLSILPSFQRVLETCAELLDFDVAWRKDENEANRNIITAIGSAPSDETVKIIKLHVAAGDSILAGQIVAEVESSKAVVDIAAPISGKVVEVCVDSGIRVRVGSMLIRLIDDESESYHQPITRENPGKPILTKRRKSREVEPSKNGQLKCLVGIAAIAGATGSRIVTNEELVLHWPERQPSDILSRTGIESRRWVGEGETVLTLAIRATHELLIKQGLAISDIDLAIACTSTPDVIAPSLACRVCASLAEHGERPVLPTYDISAACSGYLFALAQAYDFLQLHPMARVLVITSEVLSPLLDLSDFDTAPIFGDAATATLIASQESNHNLHLEFSRPILSGKPESGEMLCVPVLGNGAIKMQGGKVFAEAVRSMTSMLQRACSVSSISVNDLDWIVPHQANQRILDAIAERTGRPVISAMRKIGNTSSSSVPLAIISNHDTLQVGQRIGLASFGAGTTAAAAVAIVNAPERERLQ